MSSLLQDQLVAVKLDIRLWLLLCLFVCLFFKQS